MRASPLIAFAAVLSLAGLPAGAVEPEQFTSARATGLGGNRLAASGADSLVLNPAGLGAVRGYALQLDYAHTTVSDGDGFGVAIVDSLTNPLFPTGLSYRYFSVGPGGKDAKGSIKDAALAYPLSDNVLLGARVSWLSYTTGGRALSQFTGDLGALVRVGWFNAGLVGYHLLKVDTPEAPRGLGTGLSFGDGHSFLLAADYRWEWPDERTAQSYSFAGEYLLFDMVPLRDGWAHDGRLGANFWSTGLGFVTDRVGGDASYRRNLLTGEGMLAFTVTIYGN